MAAEVEESYVDGLRVVPGYGEVNGCSCVLVDES